MTSRPDPTADGTPAESSFGRKEWILFGSIIALAFVTRLIYVMFMRSNPTFENPIMDPLYHAEWARAFVRGESFMEGQPFFRAPLYPWFLGICFELFGENFLVPRIIQAAMGAVSCGLVFLIGRRVFSTLTGTAAGIVAATYWIFLYFDAELLIVPMIVLLDLLALWLLLRADASHKTSDYLLSGLAIGLSAIARPNVLLFGLAVCLWIVIRRRREWQHGLLHAFLFGLACLVPIIPITVRNYSVGDDLVLISSQGGVNFFIGNNPQADGTRAVVPGTRPDWWGGYHDTIAMAEQAAGRPLKPSEVSRYFFGKSFEFITEKTGEWLDLTGRKFRYYWNAQEINNNKPIGFFAERYGGIVKFLPIGAGLILPLGFLGLFLCFRRPGRLFPLWGFVLIYSGTVIAFFVCTRFRVPAMVILVILACEGARWWLTALSKKQWLAAAIAAAAIAPLAWWVNDLPDNVVDPDFQGFEIVGDLKTRQNDPDGAIALLREGLELQKDFCGLYVTLGRALIKKGETEQAMLEGQGHSAEALQARDRWYAQAAKELETAGRLRSPRSEDWWGKAAYWRGYIHANQEALDKAIAAFKLAIQLEPRSAESHYYLGFLLARVNQIDAAITHFKIAIDCMPDYVDPWVALGRAYAIKGLKQEAINALKEALRLDPSNGEANDLLRRLMSQP